MQFTQEQLVAAYRQMEQERQTDSTYAQKAAEQLQQKLRHPQPVSAKESAPSFNRGGITPYTTNYVLVIQLSQHDDWQQCYDDLVAAGVAMKPWNGNFHRAPEGQFDVASDSHFGGRTTQKYAVRIDYYDGGY